MNKDDFHKTAVKDLKSGDIVWSLNQGNFLLVLKAEKHNSKNFRFTWTSKSKVFTTILDEDFIFYKPKGRLNELR